MTVFLLLALFLLPTPGRTQDMPENTLTLENAWRMALENNDAIKISRENRIQAERDLDTARSYLYPQINLTGSAIRQKDLNSTAGMSSLLAALGAEISPDDLEAMTSPDEYELLQVTLDQNIYQFGKVWAGKEVAARYLESARLTHSQTVREILYRISSAYFDVLLGQRSIGIAQSALRRAEKQQERANVLLEVGASTRTSVLRADVQVAEAGQQLENARNNYLLARETLALELGVDGLPEAIEEPGQEEFPGQPVDDLIQQALKNRKDLQAAASATAAAREMIAWERADFLPKIFLHGEYAYTSEPYIFNQNDDNWNASLNLSCPLFAGGRNRSELAGAKSKHRQAQMAEQRLEKIIRTEVRSVYLNLQTQRKVLKQYQAQVESAESNYEQVAAQFENGLASSVDQVDADTALNQAQSQLAQSHYAYRLNLIRLRLVTGTLPGDDSDLR